MIIKEMEYGTKMKRELIATGEYKDYMYFVYNLGTHPTAYVAIPKEHPYYKKHYNDCDILVHGGLTFCNNELHGLKSDYDWFIGWDYAHAGDYMGFYENMPDYLEISTDKKWTTEEIIAECLIVIAQLEKVKHDKEKTTD